MTTTAAAIAPPATPQTALQIGSDSGGHPDTLAWRNLADRLQAAAEPTRLRLLAVLRAMPQQQACVSELTDATQLPQPMVSHHLQILYRAALVTRNRHGSRAYYRLNQPELAALAERLASPPSSTIPPAAAPQAGLG